MDSAMSILQTLGNWALVAISFVLAKTGLPLTPLIWLVIMMALDLVSGMIRAHAQGEELTTHRFKSGFLVKLMILIVPAVITGVADSGKSMFPEIGDFTVVVQFAVMMIIVGEAVSVIGNIHAAKTGKPKKEWDYLSIIMSKLYDMISKVDGRGK